MTVLTRLDHDILIGCALIEIAAALDAAGLLPEEHPALDGIRNYVAAADAGAFGTGTGLPQPPQGKGVPPGPPVDTNPELTAARRRAARKPAAPNWGRRRKTADVIDLSAALAASKEPARV